MKRLSAAVVSFALLSISIVGCSREATYEKPLVPVQVQPVEGYAGERGMRYAASIRPRVQIDLVFRTGGYVRELLEVTREDNQRRQVQEGDRVVKGTVLARLQEKDYSARANQAKAQSAEAEAICVQAKSQIAEAKSALKLAQRNFERAETLYELRSLTRPEYDSAIAQKEAAEARTRAANAQFSAAEARWKAARAALDEAEATLNDTAIRAPLDGVVLKRNIEIGSFAGPGPPAFVLADTTSMKVVFGVPDTVVQELQTGTALTVTAEAVRGIDFPGKITRISPSADLSSRTFEVEVSIPNPENQLKSGMIASVRLPDSAPPLQSPALVPLGAIVRPKAGAVEYAVFVVEEQSGRHVARIRPIKPGETVGSKIAVREGVQIGEHLIVTGAQFVEDGQEVRLVP